MSGPLTDAGRAFIADWEPTDGPDDTVERAILAIEAEARATALEEAAEQVRGLPTWDKRTVPGGHHVNRAAVLSLLSTEDGS